MKKQGFRHNHLAVVVILTACLTWAGYFRTGTTIQANYQASRLSQTQLSKIVTIETPQYHPAFHFRQGRELELTPALETQLSQFQGIPKALASGDFDSDGMKDVIVGYETATGGTVIVFRGNPETFAPSDARTQKLKAEGTFTESPLLETGVVIDIPNRPDFLGAGDFNGDGTFDLVTATRGESQLHLLSGNGKGELGHASTLEIPGQITALVLGDVNRQDGLADVLVSVAETETARLLVFESPDGALRHEPEVLTLPAPATAIAVGELGGSPFSDIAVAAGTTVLVAEGRDRKLSVSDKQVEPLRINQRKFDFEIKSLALGDFEADDLTDIAVLSTDGQVEVLSREMPAALRQSASLDYEIVTSGQKGVETTVAVSSGVVAAAKALRAPVRLSQWTATPFANVGAEANQLVRVKSSSLSHDDLAVIGEAADIRLLGNLSQDQSPTKKRASGSSSLQVTLPSQTGAPVAMLPMLLNGDGLQDLVVVTRNSARPGVLFTQPLVVYTVNSTTDTGTGTGTSGDLRYCITQANLSAGADSINFAIPGSGVQTITLASGLPFITQPLTIDGYTQTGASANTQAVGSDAVLRIEINADALAVNTPAVPFNNGSAGSRIRGLVINRANDNQASAITFNQSSTGMVDGNFLGTSADGTTSLPNNRSVTIFNASTITIGGTTPQARNVISGGASSVNINVNGGSGHLIQGNYVGLNAAGTATIDAGFETGIFLLGATTTNGFVGGTAAGAGNVVGVRGIGVYVADFSSNMTVQQNLVGLNATGTASLAATATGMQVEDSASALVGGTTAAARNVVGGTGLGVTVVDTSTSALIQGNYFGTNSAGTTAIANSVGVSITRNTTGHTIGGTAAGAQNVISSSGFEGIQITQTNGPHTVQGNLIGRNAANTAPLGNGTGIGIGVPAFPANNTLVGGTGAGEGNIIAHSAGVGIRIEGGTMNRSLGNTIFGSGSLGIDLAPVGGNGVTPNDTGDPDAGPNNLQNFPVITPISATSVSASLDSLVTNTAYPVRLEFFANAACKPEGTSEGEVFLGTTNLAGPGSVTFNFTAVPGRPIISATATDNNGNTSEFSSCFACPTVTGTVSGGATICAGSSAQVTVAVTGGTGPYSVTLNNGGGTQTGSSPLTFTVSPTVTTTYMVQSGTDADTCPITGSGSATITVQQPPTPANAGPDQTICASTPSTTLAANLPAIGAGNWSVVSGPSTSATQFGNVSVNSTTFTPAGGPGVYTLQWTTSNSPCTSSSDTMTVTVNPVATVNAGPDQTICATGSAQLAGTVGGSATSGTWSGGGGTFTPNAGTLTAQYTPTAGEISSGSVTLTLTTNDPTGPCGAVSDTVTITLSASATVDAGANQTICSTETVTLNGSIGGAASSATWTGGTGTFTPNAGTLNAVYTPSAAEISAGSVTLTLTTNDPAGDCVAVSDTVTITINLAATVNAGPDQAVCASTLVQLAGSVGGSAASSTWSGGGGTFTPNAGTLTAQYTPTAGEISAGSVTLTLTTNDPAGPCGAVSDTVTITFSPFATVDAGANQTICSTETVTLNGSIGGGASSATWTGGTGTFTPNASALNAVYAPSAGEISAGSVTLTLTTNDPPGSCVAVSDTVTITINLAATVNAGPDQTLCSTALIQLAGTVGGGATSGTWSGGTGTFAPNANALGAIYTPSPAEITAGTVTLTLTTNDPAGLCGAVSDTVTITLTGFCGVELPILYVADTMNHRVQKYDGLTWQVIGAGVIGTGPGQFRLPEAVTADGSGQRIYVADTGNNRIQWSTDGGTTWADFATIGTGLNQVRGPQGLALDQAGNLYVSDTNNKRVLRFNGGVPGVATLLASVGGGLGEVTSPHGLAIDANFNLYIADRVASRVLRISNANTVTTPNSGTVIAQSGNGLSPGEVQSPVGVAVDNDRNLYVADSGNNRILMFFRGNSGSATVLASGGSDLGQVVNPEGVTVTQFMLGPESGRRNLVVGNTGNHRIESREFGSSVWRLVGTPNLFGSAVGQFNQPSKIR
ncbi:MAG: VCBS repeat-containing protein [Acidobacteria bacterium]|nr:VCBS repeat-containing protein [Acidobacteriota bacterium]